MIERLENTREKAIVLTFEEQVVTVPRATEEVVADKVTPGLMKKVITPGAVDVDGEWLARLRTAKGTKKIFKNGKAEVVESDELMYSSVAALFESGSLVLKATKRAAAPPPK